MKKYFNLVKIEHTLFSLPIIYAGTILAAKKFPAVNISGRQIFWIFIAAASARAAGFGLNRILDKNIDAKNPRTQNREIPTGKISLKAAWTFTAICGILFILSSGMLNRTCFFLSLVPLALFAIYPILKRLTAWTHLGLGLAWGIAPIGGWLAVRPQIFPLQDLTPILLLSTFSIFWVAGFDILYALLDESFDRSEGVHSAPALLGTHQALLVSEILHGLGVIFLFLLVRQDTSSIFCYISLGLITILFAWSHWRLRVKPLTPKEIDFAFFKVNAAIGFLVFFLVLFGGV